MKRILLAAIAFSLTMTSFAQTDTTGTERADTIRIGGMIIIKKPGKDGKEDKEVIISNRRKRRSSNVSTNWFIVDLGFANFNDKTNYGSAEAMAFTDGITDKDQLELRTAKSVNVNIWFFMQRLNLIKHAVNLKYGLGLELNNYHFDDKRVHFQKNPTLIILDDTYADLKKNKLAADYITVPMMLNVNFTPNRGRSFGFSGGVSAGFLYSARQKIKGSDGKHKLHDDFDLRKWKLSYIGELNLGPVKLYGSYAMKSMWEKGLDQTPYNVGIRLGNW
jgi:hypothetical protein